jgi:cation transport regulator ChaC
VATERNQNYLGPAPLDAIARQVREARGPSGANLEYVLRLADSLREMDASDPHVFALEALLLQEEIA